MPVKLTREQLHAKGRGGTVADRFWRSVEKTDGCWIWTKGQSSRGYGRIHTPASSSTAAHRVSYVLHNGEIADGLVIDHICRNRICVNPEHLRAVTPAINSLENSESPTALNAVKTECVRGHELSGHNLVIKRLGWRNCRQCQVEHNRKYDRTKRNRKGASHA